MRKQVVLLTVTPCSMSSVASLKQLVYSTHFVNGHFDKASSLAVVASYFDMVVVLYSGTIVASHFDTAVALLYLHIEEA